MKKKKKVASETDIAIERYKAFLATSSEAIWRFELDEPILISLSIRKQINLIYKHAYLAECNDALAHMYGMKSGEEMVGTRLGDLLPRSEKANIEYLTNFIKSDYRLVDAESKEYDRNGEVHYFVNNLVGIVENGKVLRAWGTQRDITKQRTLEEQLFHHSRLLENISDAVISIDLDKKITSWNAGAEMLYGWKQDDVIGKYISDIIPVKEFVTSSLKDYRESLKKIGKWMGEVIQNNKDGASLHILGTVSVVTDDKGKTIGVVALNRNITEKKKSEDERNWLLAEVQYQRKRLNDIMNDVPGIIWEAYGKPDQQSQRINFVSGYVKKMLGYSVSDWLNTPNFWLKIVHPEDREKAAAVANEKFEKKQSGVNRFRWITKKGKVIWVDAHSSVIVDGSGKAIGMRGVTMDITQSKMADDALQISEAKYRNLVQLAPDVIYSIDLEGKLISLSPSFEVLTGWKVKDWVGKHFLGLVHPEDTEYAKERFISGLKVPLKEPYHIRIMTQKGRVIVGEFRSTPYFENGKLIGLIGIGRNITERIELEKRKDDFISMASHELKTPVTSLKLYTQVLEKQFSKTNEKGTGHALEKMNNQIERLTNLIGDLLDLSRIQAGKLHIRPAVFSLTEVTQEVVESIQATTTHPLIFRSTENISVYADKERVAQVLINLLTNAVKYSPDQEKIVIIFKVQESSVIVSVRDYGQGISKEHISKIFDRFYQIQENGKSAGGLGIGLHISNEIIKRNGGEMWVQSKEGYGSTFFFSLPLPK